MPPLRSVQSVLDRQEFPGGQIHLDVQGAFARIRPPVPRTRGGSVDVLELL
jgi:hypothetical protein